MKAAIVPSAACAAPVRSRAAARSESPSRRESGNVRAYKDGYEQTRWDIAEEARGAAEATGGAVAEAARQQVTPALIVERKRYERRNGSPRRPLHGQG
jgi:hypothetical protein